MNLRPSVDAVGLQAGPGRIRGHELSGLVVGELVQIEDETPTENVRDGPKLLTGRSARGLIVDPVDLTGERDQEGGLPDPSPAGHDRELEPLGYPIRAGFFPLHRPPRP